MDLLFPFFFLTFFFVVIGYTYRYWVIFTYRSSLASFNSKDEKLLKEWSESFRQGAPCLKNLKKNKDTRTIKLPEPESGTKRRKPFLGASVIRREDVYQWLRETQSRLVDNDISKDKKRQEMNKKICRHVIKSMTPNVYQLVYDESSTKKQPVFIEVNWSISAGDAFEQEDPPLYRVIVEATRKKSSSSSSTSTSSSSSSVTTKLPIYVMTRGKGAFFDASTLPPGIFTINGCKFTVKDSIKKKKTSISIKRKRKTLNNDDDTKDKTKKNKRLKTSKKGNESPSKLGHISTPGKKGSRSSQRNSSSSSSSSSSSKVKSSKKSSVKSTSSSSSKASTKGSRSSSFVSSSSSSSEKGLHATSTPSASSTSSGYTVGSFSPQVVLRGDNYSHRYVTVKWNQRSSSVTGPPPRFLTIGNIRVDLFTVEHGNSVFRPSKLDVGDYNVDGVAFSVFDEGSPIAIQSDSSTHSNGSEKGDL